MTRELEPLARPGLGHANYLAYLDACGMQSAKVAQGFADYGTFQTLVSAQYENGNALGDEELHSIALHELTHLLFHGIESAGMPY